VQPSARATVVHSRTSSAEGRRRYVLSPQDAKRIYELAHGGPLVAFATADVKVRLDARADPAAERLFSPLDRFLRYKAHTIHVRQRDQVMNALAEVHAAMLSLKCDGHRDPRALPLHVFAPDIDLVGLDELEGRVTFDRRFGGPNNRHDGQGRQWATGAMHGTKTVSVADAVLPTGWHWDIQADRNSSTVSTGWEVWELLGRSGHLNITPDASVRAGKQSRRLWHFGIALEQETHRSRRRRSGS
jgi:hypothetical protein